MHFEACLSLPRNAREARIIADTFESLARALREWPTDSWSAVESNSSASGLFERLIRQTAPYAVNERSRQRAERSADAVAGVLRVLWPSPSATNPPEADDTPRALSAAS